MSYCGKIVNCKQGLKRKPNSLHRFSDTNNEKHISYIIYIVHSKDLLGYETMKDGCTLQENSFTRWTHMDTT